MSSACLPHAICLQVTLNGTWQLSKGNRRKEAKTPVARGIFFFLNPPGPVAPTGVAKTVAVFLKSASSPY